MTDRADPRRSPSGSGPSTRTLVLAFAWIEALLIAGVVTAIFTR